MEKRPLGKTGIDLPILSFGASSLGAEFRAIDLNEAFSAVHTALDLGINFIDTSPFYGRGMSEVMLGQALKGISRESYLIGTKLGRYTDCHFDFSATRVEESIHTSLHRLGTDHLDLLLVLEVRGLDVLEILLARDHGLPVLGHLLVQAGILKLGPSSDAFILGFHQERSLGLLGRHAGLCGARARHLDCVRKLKREGKRFAADAALGMSLHVGCTDRHRADTRLHFLREERDLLV